MSAEGNASHTLNGKLSRVFSNVIDNTLSLEGACADAKATGDAIAEVKTVAESSIRYKRLLTSADDLNNIVEPGVYYFSTSSLPGNCPYVNAGIVEVVATDSTTVRIIQRVTRYGDPGYSSERVRDHTGAWRDWTRVPLIYYKTYNTSTNSNGNTNTSINHNYIILAIYAVDASGGSAYICNQYRSNDSPARWWVNLTSVSDKTNIKNTSVTLHIYYMPL